MGDDGLPRADVDDAIAMRDAKHPLQHQRVFIEFGRLPRLDPASRALHVRNAQRLGRRVDPANVFPDELRLVAHRLDELRPGDERRHDESPTLISR